MGVPRLAKNAKHLLLFLFFAYQAWKKKVSNNRMNFGHSDHALLVEAQLMINYEHPVLNRAKMPMIFPSAHRVIANTIPGVQIIPLGPNCKRKEYKNPKIQSFFTFPKKESLQPSIFFCQNMTFFQVLTLTNNQPIVKFDGLFILPQGPLL